MNGKETPEQRRNMEMTPKQKAVNQLIAALLPQYQKVKDWPLEEVLELKAVQSLGSVEAGTLNKADNPNEAGLFDENAQLSKKDLIIEFAKEHNAKTLAELLEAYQTSKSK